MTLNEKIVEIYGSGTVIKERQRITGGDINDAFMLQLSNGEAVFMKKNSLSALPSLQAEVAGLTAICDTHTIRTPQVLGIGTDQSTGSAYLLLEYLPGQYRVKDYWETFAAELASLHLADPECIAKASYTKGTFGFCENNYIGSTPQINTPHNTWIGFFRECRLEPQFRFASKWFDRDDQKKIRFLLDHLDKWLTEPEGPSLLHGDLWNGNVITGKDGKAWLIDPAVYIGHHEADIAMTELFGGFPAAFYDTYAEISGMDSGYNDRRDLYNLYHLLNHLNLFAGGYSSSVRSTIRYYAGR